MNKFNRSIMKGTAVFCIIAFGISIVTITSSQNVNARPPCKIVVNGQWVNDPNCENVPWVIVKCWLCPWNKIDLTNLTKISPKVPEDLLKHDAYVLILQNDTISLVPTQADTMIKILKEAKIMP